MGIQASKQQAQQCLQQGRAGQARGLLEPLVAQADADAEAWFLLGLARGQDADTAGAEQAFRRCIELQPGASGAWDNLGQSLLQQGRLEEAGTCFRRSLELNGNNPVAHLGLGQVYRCREQPERGVPCLETALRLAPGHAVAHLELALGLRMLQRRDEALPHARAATEADPNLAEAWLVLGELLHAGTDFEGALRAFRQSLARRPSAEAWCALGALMEELNRRDAAADSYRHALALQPDSLRAQVRLGAVLRGKGELEAAREQLEAALRNRPDHPVASAELAGILTVQGDYEGAAQRLEPFLTGSDTPVDIALAYAEVGPRLGEAARTLEILEQCLARDDLTDAHREGLLFAAARRHEQAGQYERAFQRYREAHGVRPLPDDLDRHLAEMEAIQQYFTRERLDALPRSGIDSQRPVFIVGMPRSGTSLVEQILAAHPRVHGGGELTALWRLIRGAPEQAGGQAPFPGSVTGMDREVLATMGQQYLETLDALAAGADRVTDKLPHHFLHLGMIELLFPRARVIHCIRDPLDTCLSNYFQRFNTSHLYARDLHSLGRYHRAYEALMTHWNRVLTIPLFTLRYEDLVEDTEGLSRELLAFCGLEWDPACLRFHEQSRAVNTPSHAQVRQPVYRSAVQRWRRFEPWIGPLREGLAATGRTDET